jgi:hypothetical protein
MSPVFISHRKADEQVALYVDNHLKKFNIRTFIDCLDPELQNNQNADKVTEIIIRRLSQCNHLIAVFSQNTQGSWWVPFEIGVATKGDSRIATYTRNLSVSEMPEYLRNWPVLTKTDDLFYYAETYLQDETITFAQKKSHVERELRTASDFHNTLKRRLGQY